MPEAFVKSFAGRLDSLYKISVEEAQGHERILPGHLHLLLKRSGVNIQTELCQSPVVNFIGPPSKSCSARRLKIPAKRNQCDADGHG